MSKYPPENESLSHLRKKNIIFKNDFKKGAR